jgi:hypothetical protein
MQCDTVKGLMARARAALTPEAPKVPNNLAEAVKHLQVHPSQLYSTRNLKYFDRADWTGAPKPLLDFAYRFYRRTQAINVPMYAHTVWRSPQLQRRLYDDGYSNLKSGAHQRSCAIDFVHSDYHWDLHRDRSVNRDLWEYIGTIGKECARITGVKMRWGGDWRDPWDPAHWELENWRDFPEVPEPQGIKLTPGALKNA